MRIVDNFSIKLVQELDANQSPKSEVYVDNESINVLIEGEILEGVVEIGNKCYLLFLTHNIIFEECVTVALIDTGKKMILDIFYISKAYDTDTFGGLQIINSKICFEFMAKYPWHIEVLPYAKYTFPLTPFYPFSLIYRKFSLKHYLVIKNKKID